MKVIGVIPARYSSTRMPGKPLMDICGKPMIWWVYQQAKKSKLIDDVILAVDDSRISDVCKQYNMNYILTSKNHDTPTSRLYEVSTKINADLYLLLMGDEPLLNSECFSLIIPDHMESEYYVGALTNIMNNPVDVVDFSNQKVVVNSNREALFISRSPIPYPKGYLEFQYEKITGVQIFSKAALSFYNNTEKSILEKAEENDMLRFIENGIKVKMTVSDYKTVSVDTPKDLDYVRKIINSQMYN